jgi:hypothetical protein
MICRVYTGRGPGLEPPDQHRMPKPSQSRDELITLVEASQRYGLSPETLRLPARRGRLKARKRRRDWFTTAKDMEAYLASRSKTGRYRREVGP